MLGRSMLTTKLYRMAARSTYLGAERSHSSRLPGRQLTPSRVPRRARRPAKVAAETPAAQDGRTQGDKQDGQSRGMDGIVLPGEQETLEAEQGAQGEEGFRGGGAGNECAVSGYPLGILMEPPRDPGEKEDETKLDKAVQARRRERMHENTPKKGTETSGWRGESEVSRGNIPKDFSFLLSTELLRKILERARMLQKNDKEEARSSIPNKKISD